MRLIDADELMRRIRSYDAIDKYRAITLVRWMPTVTGIISYTEDTRTIREVEEEMKREAD